MPKALKTKVSDNYMDSLSTETGLTHDGPGDTRLFPETIITKSADMSAVKYKAMEKDIGDYLIKGNGFEVYAWNDSSGYDYWTVKQREDNYIQVTVNITGLAIPKDVADAAQKAYNYFLKYQRQW